MTTQSRSSRTFVAIVLPPTLGDKLAELIAKLAPELSSFRFARDSTFHLTLAFLGDILSDDVPRIAGAVDAAVASLDPFELCMEGVGVFPTPSRPRVIWSGFAPLNREVLMALQARIVDSVSSAGFPPDDGRFHPHVTLARSEPGRRQPRDIIPVLNQYRSWSPGSFVVEEVTTFTSILLPRGPKHTPVASALLKGDKSWRTLASESE